MPCRVGTGEVLPGANTVADTGQFARCVHTIFTLTLFSHATIAKQKAKSVLVIFMYIYLFSLIHISVQISIFWVNNG